MLITSSTNFIQCVSLGLCSRWFTKTYACLLQEWVQKRAYIQKYFFFLEHNEFLGVKYLITDLIQGFKKRNAMWLVFFSDADKYIPSGRLNRRANFLVQRLALFKLGGIDSRPCLIRCNLTHIGWRIKVGRRQWKGLFQRYFGQKITFYDNSGCNAYSWYIMATLAWVL